MNTYETAAEAQEDRRQQLALLAALNAWERALRRDECSAWRINGTRGGLYTWGDGRTWVLVVQCRSARHWTATKERLAFCTVTQDGHDEGCLRLHALPTPEQAEIIRSVLGIRKRVELSAERRETLSKQLAHAQKSANRVWGLPNHPETEIGGESPPL